eukprot:scaffold26892_cov36-Cyclotella_meneghiniana.AAC.2
MPWFKPLRAYAYVITNSPLYKGYMFLVQGRLPTPLLHSKKEKKKDGYYDDLTALDGINERLDGFVSDVIACHHYLKGYRERSFFSLRCLGKDLLKVSQCLAEIRLRCLRVHPLQLREENGGDIALRAKRNGTNRANRYNRRSNPLIDDVFAPPPRSITGLRDAVKKFGKIVRDRIEAGGGNAIMLQAVVGTMLWDFSIDGVVVLTFNGETGQLVE